MNLPTISTSLFGRESELALVAQYLDDPDYRLVTLVGPGGIGKTRLGIEAARRYGDRTKDGAIFIDLQAIDAPDLVMQALADSLQVSIQDRDAAAQQVAQFLDGKETLLFFDNFEQVLDAAPLIGQLIDISPGTTALVTSRSPLRLTQEWLMHVDGLSVPQPNRPRSTKENASTLLFVDRARKVSPDLSVEQERPSIERICQLTDGMPLAIEIAASWTGVLDCSEIATEIEKSRQFLASEMRDVPERHRSIQAVFDQSMQLLDERERKAFDRLSVFRGGFTRDAADKVAGADLRVLLSLVDRSLIRRTQDGRYRIHELVRQFGEDQLSKSEDEFVDAQATHTRYFMKFLADRHHDISVARQVGAAIEVEVELENVRTAWDYAVDHLLATEVADAVVPLAQFIQYRGRYAVGGQTFTRAVSVFKDADQGEEVQRALALMLVEHGWFNLRQGRLDASEAAFQESFEIHECLGMRPIHGFAMDPQLALGYVASTRGDMELANAYATSGLRRALAENHTQHRGMANQLLGHLALREGKLEEARESVRAALAACDELGEKWFTSYCHNELGEVAVALGDYGEADEQFRASLQIGEDFGDRAGVGLSQVYLGEVASLLGETERARTYFEDSKIAYLQLGDRGGIARADVGLGVLAVGAGDFPDARKRLSDVLDTSVAIQFVAMILDVLAAVGELALRTGMDTDGERLVSFVDGHASAEARTRTRLRNIARSKDLQPENGGDIENHIVLARSVLEDVQKLSVSSTAPEQERSDQQLADPLTERELEVLVRMAEGMVNQQIADALIVSLGTVKWYSNQIYTKLGVHNRTSAVATARTLSIITAQA